MYYRIISLLNVKPNETGLVKRLFLVQFFLGVATAFLFTGSLALFLSAYDINLLPRVYLLAASLLLVFNYLYARLEERLSPENLLKVVIIFSAASLFIYWFCLSFFSNPWLPLFLAVWNMVVYMLVGYAFWGMAAILFNVRESKRLFSIVGAGDIPAKMLGYFSVSALVPLIGVKNLTWVSIGAFLIAYYLLQKYAQNSHFKINHQHHASSHGKTNHAKHEPGKKSFIQRYFYNQLIFFISLWSLLAYSIFAFIDFTFLAEIKNKYQAEHELAYFLGIFFAFGRFLAIIIKIVFSSRMIARIGLANSLLVTPMVLLLITAYFLYSDADFSTHLYIFGCMVLLAEILRSTLQEPVFFILFQPLNPHIRLKGHLIAKGYMLPFALLGVGLFLTLHLQQEGSISIFYVVKLLMVLLFLWAISVPLIRLEYRRTLVSALKKGYFTGTELFLNDAKVISTLLKKIRNAKPIEVIHALNLLEQSGYQKFNELLLELTGHSSPEVKEYVLANIIQKNITDALPLIRKQLETTSDTQEEISLVMALFYLDDRPAAELLAAIQLLDQDSKKAALVGLLRRKDARITEKVTQELILLAESSLVADKLLACQIITETRTGDFSSVLPVLLQDNTPQVFNSAVEAAGKVKDFSLFPLVFSLAAEKKAFSALTIALLEYGDEVYAEKYLQNQQPDRSIENLLVKVAGKIKGDNSTRFLLRLLEENYSHTDNILIESLWAKKTKISAEDARLIEGWIDKKLNQSQIKSLYYNQLAPNKKVKVLQTALGSEIKQDLMALLKGLALLYERQQLDRIIQLYQLGNAAKISNAIEMLELILPKKLFMDLNNLIELVQDINTDQPVIFPGKLILTADAIVQEILLQNKAGCNLWTKSVALYVVPELQHKNFPAGILEQKAAPGDKLFQETQDYILSVLN